MMQHVQVTLFCESSQQEFAQSKAYTLTAMDGSKMPHRVLVCLFCRPKVVGSYTTLPLLDKGLPVERATTVDPSVFLPLGDASNRGEHNDHEWIYQESS